MESYGYRDIATSSMGEILVETLLSNNFHFNEPKHSIEKLDLLIQCTCIICLTSPPTNILYDEGMAIFYIVELTNQLLKFRPWHAKIEFM